MRAPIAARGLLLVAVTGVIVLPALAQAPAPAPGAVETPARPPRPTRAPGPQRDADLALVGVVVRQDGQPLAIIEDRGTRKQTLYKLGALVRGGRVTSIAEDRVVLTFTGGDVELRLATSPSGTTAATQSPAPPTVAAAPSVPVVAATPPVNDHFQQIDRATLGRFLGALDLVTGVTAVDGGVKVADVRGASLFQALGLSKGDLIKNVNGKVPGAGGSLSQVIQQAAQQGMMRFELQRDGRPDVKYLQIKP